MSNYRIFHNLLEKPENCVQHLPFLLEQRLPSVSPIKKTSLLSPPEKEETPVELAVAKFPWAKTFSEGKSLSLYDNSLFLNLYSQSLFKDLVCVEDVAPLFGVTNRALKRDLYEDFLLIYQHQKTKYNVFNFIKFEIAKYFLEQCPDLDQQLLIPLAEKETKELDPYFVTIKYFVEELKKHSANSKIEFELLFSIFDLRPYDLKGFVNDTVLMLKQVMLRQENNGMIYVEDKFVTKEEFFSWLLTNHNTVKKIHDVLSFYAAVNSGSVGLQTDQKFLNGKKISGVSIDLTPDVFTIHVPTTSYELVQVGRILGICVGNGEYERKIKMNFSNILFLKKGNKVCYCVEYKYKKIFQIKAQGNRENRHLYKPLSSVLKDISFKDKVLMIKKTRGFNNMAWALGIWASAVSVIVVYAWLS